MVWFGIQKIPLTWFSSPACNNFWLLEIASISISSLKKGKRKGKKKKLSQSKYTRDLLNWCPPDLLDSWYQQDWVLMANALLQSTCCGFWLSPAACSPRLICVCYQIYLCNFIYYYNYINWYPLYKHQQNTIMNIKSCFCKNQS